MERTKPKLIVIAGPTASGKTSLAVDLAEHFGGEIISVDSMQVYRHMDIGTAKPSKDEMRDIVHHMIDIVDPDEEFNASLYRSMAVRVIEEAIDRGKICFAVGGTGLYLKTLLRGIMKCPPADSFLREHLKLKWEEQGPAFMHRQLERLDPEAASRIHPNDRIRVLRSLEIINLTDRTITDLTGGHRFQESYYETLKLGLEMERSKLYKRINERSFSMVDNGLIEETHSLIDMGYSTELKPMKSIGYRHAVGLLKGIWNKEKMIFEFQKDTRRYAKRQLTWFRNDHDYMWVNPDSRDLILKKVREFIDR
ncbi:MAG: tRNA (adenosine(37)-N6)-dimethylallyltransferase MiaA [Deltaproteobacteria bacterium]|nr:tRNA (adenosine(37)-N6)-dimethylallyltransferase MiaA [Deltaproteobacteria bacterium]